MEAVTFFTSQFAHMSGDDMDPLFERPGHNRIIVYSLARGNVKVYNVIMSKGIQGSSGGFTDCQPDDLFCFGRSL